MWYHPTDAYCDATSCKYLPTIIPAGDYLMTVKEAYQWKDIVEENPSLKDVVIAFNVPVPATLEETTVEDFEALQKETMDAKFEKVDF